MPARAHLGLPVDAVVPHHPTMIRSSKPPASSTKSSYRCTTSSGNNVTTMISIRPRYNQPEWTSDRCPRCTKSTHLGEAISEYPHELVIGEIRRTLEARRRSGVANPSTIEPQVLASLDAWRRPSLQRVINATGVILHTNLGRAPLGVTDMSPVIPTLNTISLPVDAASAMSTSRRCWNDCWARRPSP